MTKCQCFSTMTTTMMPRLFQYLWFSPKIAKLTRASTKVDELFNPTPPPHSSFAPCYGYQPDVTRASFIKGQLLTGKSFDYNQKLKYAHIHFIGKLEV